MNIKDFKVGQKVIIASRQQRHMEYSISSAEIVKVGRKYVTIDNHWATQFEETGDNRPYLIEHAAYGSTQKLFPSEEDWKEYTEQIELGKWLTATVSKMNVFDYSVYQLRKIKKILEEK